MAFTHVYTVPDYYKDFVCKGSACRRTCCKGWPVSLSMTEYFRLLGINCSKKLRKRLDCAFYSANDRDSDRYVLFCKNQDGDCPLHLADGYCGIQKECGEAVLPAVCRYYPRAIRAGVTYECSCSASCERVVEMLIGRRDKLMFESRELTFLLASDAPLSKDTAKSEFYRAMRSRCLEILQNRDYTLAERLYTQGAFVREVYRKGIKTAEGLHESVSYDKNYRLIATDADAVAGFNQIRTVAQRFEEDCLSLGGFGETVESVYAEGVGGYLMARDKFEAAFPNWQIMFENLLVNHLFYDRFPFSNKYESIKDSYFALCGTYAFLRYMAIGYTFAKPATNDFVDVVAASFRLIEHSAFDKNVEILMSEQGVDTLEKLAPLMLV